MKIFLSSTDSAEYLGVSRRTLYAYVSRGWIRSELSPGSRERRYNRLDLERLRERKQVRRDPSKKVATALFWGVPLLETGLTLIDQGRLYYRGRDAVELARNETFFQVVNWFWNQPESFVRENSSVKAVSAKAPPATSSPLSEFQRLLVQLGDQDPRGYDFSTNILVAGWSILELFLRCLTGKQNASLLHAATELQRSWAPDRPELVAPLNAGLILSIDHESNVSSFTARVVASAGSNLYEVVNAAVCAMRGSRHGGRSLLAHELLGELRCDESLRPTLVRWLRERQFVPGFGHHLYPTGDPRARALLELLKQGGAGEAQLRVVRQASRVLRKQANIDLALAALARAFDLPPQAPLGIFTLGRIAGWIGHAVEQRTSENLIRPRARYIGPLPNR